jgi:hypothetical protein
VAVVARSDTLLGHCLARAALAGGFDVGKSAKWAAIKATPKAARVAGFVVLWAVEVRENGDPESNADMARRLGDPPRTFYRRLAEFRELWREYETPAELAALLNDQLDRRELTRSGPMATVTV